MISTTYKLIPEKDSVSIYNMNKFTGFELLKKLKKDDSVRFEKIQKLISDSGANLKQEIKLLQKDYFLEPIKIGCLSKGKVDSLLTELERLPSESIFKELGYNEDSLRDDAFDYWELFLQNQKKKTKLKDSQKDYCLKQLQNINNLQYAALTMIRNKAFSDYGYVSIKVYSTNDTLEYQTKGTNQFMLPWFNARKQTIIYNPNTSMNCTPNVGHNIWGVFYE